VVASQDQVREQTVGTALLTISFLDFCFMVSATEQTLFIFTKQSWRY